MNSYTQQTINSEKNQNDASSEVDTNTKDTLSYRVLIVDDSVLIHRALDIELTKAPFISNKDYAESGEDCLTLINQHQYDIIFLDIMMPGIDGFETCNEIRKIASYKKVPIIMLSAKTSPLDEVKGVISGCTTYLTKPIIHEDFQKLLDRMGNWLENYKTA
jgi:twitching motility two-component system response regulator PilG